MAGVLDVASKLWRLGRAAEDLFEGLRDIRASVKVIGDRLKALEDRMTYLEANQTQVVTEARAAASAASTSVAPAILAEAFTRLTRLEVKVEQLPTPTTSSRIDRPAT